MKVTYRITEDDYASMNRFHVWRGYIARPSVVTLVAIGIIVALIGIGLWARPAIAPAVALGVAVFAILRVGRLLVQTPYQARRHYRQYKGIQEPITAELTDAAIKFSVPDGEANLPWSKILQWRQNDQFILIYPMPILYYVVPKSVVREGFDIALLIRRLAEHVGPER